MKTRDYNQNLTRKIIIAMLDGAMSIEQIAELIQPETVDDEIRVHHTLHCLRYNTWIEDSAKVWQLTEGGREYALWCKEFPQRSRRLQSDRRAKLATPINKTA